MASMSPLVDRGAVGVTPPPADVDALPPPPPPPHAVNPMASASPRIGNFKRESFQDH